MSKEHFNFNKYKTYICDYSFNGSLWSIDICAKSWEEAKQRILAISNGKIIGELDEDRANDH